MAGSLGRSGGRNRKATCNATSDGMPLSPRALSPRAQALFGWIVDKLSADDPQSGFARVDGAVIATLAEILQSQEQVSSMLADTPADLQLHRLRNNLASQIVRLSAVLGLSPFDRSRQPTIVLSEANDPFEDILRRMASDV